MPRSTRLIWFCSSVLSLYGVTTGNSVVVSLGEAFPVFWTVRRAAEPTSITVGEWLTFQLWGGLNEEQLTFKYPNVRPVVFGLWRHTGSCSAYEQYFQVFIYLSCRTDLIPQSAVIRVCVSFRWRTGTKALEFWREESNVGGKTSHPATREPGRGCVWAVRKAKGTWKVCSALRTPHSWDLKPATGPEDVEASWDTKE